MFTFICVRTCVFVQCGRSEGRKYTSGWTCQDFVARTQDSEPTNQIAATSKFNIN